MIRIILFLLINFQTFAKNYNAECKINISSNKRPNAISIIIKDETISIKFNDELLGCNFIDNFQMEIFFYRCGEYNVSFRDNLKELMFAGYKYRCDFKNE